MRKKSKFSLHTQISEVNKKKKRKVYHCMQCANVYEQTGSTFNEKLI